MKSLWNDKNARECGSDPLKLRVYTSRLLGNNKSLVLHGGGNTSVKIEREDIFGEKEDLLYIKGSGCDLVTIEPQGFSPVKLSILKKMAQLPQLSDIDMVKTQRLALADPYAPTPSVEAILHAIIPYKYVDHTHADAIVTITNTKNGDDKIRNIYDSSVLIIPYIMPGFILAKKIYEMTLRKNWQDIKGLILMNHGIFSFGENAKNSYEEMIRLVSKAERYIIKNSKISVKNSASSEAVILCPKKSVTILRKEALLMLAKTRKAVSTIRGFAVFASLDNNSAASSFSSLPNAASISTRGPLTPDHVIRTKRVPLIIKEDPFKETEEYAYEYKKYFERNKRAGLICLNPAPCWAIWPGYGIISFGKTIKENRIISDIANHTISAVKKAEALGGWKTLDEKNIFDVEYWELEQAKLKKDISRLPLEGKICIVTGAASGIGRACVETLVSQGAAVNALDINPKIQTLFQTNQVLGTLCDVTNEKEVQRCVEDTVRYFGGLDILISNAGTFPSNKKISEIDSKTWDKSIMINLTSHQLLLKHSIPYLELGIEPAVVFVASKNVPAPGIGAAAYSVPKAGLTQMARIAALELGRKGIRVNTIHPDAVFDTGLWTDEALKNRAKQYGISVKEYKTRNILNVEITSKDTAELICAAAGRIFSKTTGAQISIDGGNDRVI